MIYFDNAATTFPKPKCVIKAVNECISKYCGNPGRSSHRLSILTSEKIYEAREIITSSFDVKTYEPKHNDAWEEAYQRFLTILGKDI